MSENVPRKRRDPEQELTPEQYDQLSSSAKRKLAKRDPSDAEDKLHTALLRALEIRPEKLANYMSKPVKYMHSKKPRKAQVPFDENLCPGPAPTPLQLALDHEIIHKLGDFRQQIAANLDTTRAHWGPYVRGLPPKYRAAIVHKINNPDISVTKLAKTHGHSVNTLKRKLNEAFQVNGRAHLELLFNLAVSFAGFSEARVNQYWNGSGSDEARLKRQAEILKYSRLSSRKRSKRAAFIRFSNMFNENNDRQAASGK